MPDSTSLLNLGELTKPATVLIEKISEAMGGLFAPYQIVRVAKAEAEAERIRAEARIEIKDLDQRAFHRFLHEETRKQANIDTVTSLAIPQLSEGSRPADIENDWIVNFFDKCRLTSNEELQQLWSRILAGEANKPGRFSKRTVNFLATLEKSEAEQFTALCSFCWSFSNSRDDLVPLIFDLSDEIYEQHGVNFDSVMHLESIGLVLHHLIGVRELDLSRHLVLSYFDRSVKLTLPKATANTMSLGVVLLTRMGAELAPISGASPLNSFFDYTVKRWRKERYAPETSPLAKVD